MNTGSRPAFFKRWLTRASFHSAGKQPEDSYESTMHLTTGRSTLRQPTTTDVGMGSVRQDFLADLLMRAHTSLSVRGYKELKDKHVQTSSTSDSVGALSSMSLA